MPSEPYKFEPHAFASRIVSWPYCSYCGLVYLKNDFTAWCVKMGCNYKDHPQYKAKRYQFTDPFRRSKDT